jgi:hypothetical protein
MSRNFMLSDCADRCCYSALLLVDTLYVGFVRVLMCVSQPPIVIDVKHLLCSSPGIVRLLTIRYSRICFSYFQQLENRIVKGYLASTLDKDRFPEGVESREEKTWMNMNGRQVDSPSLLACSRVVFLGCCVSYGVVARTCAKALDCVTDVLL